MEVSALGSKVTPPIRQREGRLPEPNQDESQWIKKPLFFQQGGGGGGEQAGKVLQ